MPHRGWHHLYTAGSAADEAATALPLPRTDEDAAARVVRDGYRALQDNLLRGRQAAEELQEGGPSALARAPLNPAALASSLARAFFDPALTRPLTTFTRAWLAALSRSPAVGALEGERIPMHPQQRSEYRRAGSSEAPQLLRLSALRPGEWVGDLLIRGQVRRVQVLELEDV